MLVRAFEVEIRRKTPGRSRFPFRTPQHRLVRRSRIEPDIERIGELAVFRGVDAEILVRRLEPRLDAALLDLRRRELEQRRRVRMQLVGDPVDEERQWNTPLPLPRQRPVGPVGDHSEKTRFPP